MQRFLDLYITDLNFDVALQSSNIFDVQKFLMSNPRLEFLKYLEVVG